MFWAKFRFWIAVFSLIMFFYPASYFWPAFFFALRVFLISKRKRKTCFCQKATNNISYCRVQHIVFYIFWPAVSSEKDDALALSKPGKARDCSTNSRINIWFIVSFSTSLLNIWAYILIIGQIFTIFKDIYCIKNINTNPWKKETS